VQLEGLRQLRKIHLIGTRTHNLPDCSIVPQPTTLSRAPLKWWRNKYCHVFQWLRCGFGLVNQFIGSSLVINRISCYTLKITVTIEHIMSCIKSSNSSSGHNAVSLELRNSSEVNSYSHILSYPLGMEHTQKTQFYCCVAQTTQITSHVIAILPVHWCADCCLATSYKHLSYCCVRVSQGVYQAIPWQCVDISHCSLLKAVCPE
jgi:hypothetical protein